VDLQDLLVQKRIIICCGSGGVGKTTIAATLALQGALLGKKVLALTIDPARRLANALGMSSLGNEETLVPDEKFLEEGITPRGKLYAMMLDTKHTFDEIIQRYAPNEEVRRTILENRFYQQLSSAMAGSHEYLAMEKLYQIYLRGSYDLIILDTPPTKHAMDFLEAPGKLRAFLNQNISGWFLKPYVTAGKIGLHFFNRTVATIVTMIRSLTGADFLKDVSEFIMGLSQAFDIFRSRADEVMYVLRGDATAFILIMGPTQVSLDEAYFFYQKLSEASLPCGGFLINCVHMDYPHRASADTNVGARDLIEALIGQRGLSGSLATALVENYYGFKRLRAYEEGQIERFLQRISGKVPTAKIPYFDDEIYDIRGLKRMATVLFPSGSLGA